MTAHPAPPSTARIVWLTFLTCGLPTAALASSEGAEGGAVEPSYPSSPPISIDDTEPVDKGHFEINLTASFSGRGGSWESEAPLLDANYGLFNNVQINAEIPYVFGQEDGVGKHGIGTGAAAIKVRVVNKERLALTLHPAIEFPPLPAGSYEDSGYATVTVPVALNVAVGQGGGLGFNLSRSFTRGPEGGSWGAAVGFGHPIGASGDLLLDYAQETDAHLAFGEGWVEAGYTRGALFGQENLTLLSSIGLSTQANVSALLGVQIWR